MFNLKEGATARRGSLSTAENLPESAILLYSVGSFELWIDQDIGVLFVKKEPKESYLHINAIY